MSPDVREFHEALLALGEGLVGVAFLAEAAFRGLAAVAEPGVDVAAEEAGDVDLHLLAAQVLVVHHVAVDGAGLYFGNMMATSGQTREQAGQLVLQLSLFCTWICFSPLTP